MVHGSNTSATMSHSTQCRNRITEAIAATPAGRVRLDKLTDKENRHLAEHLRQQTEDDTAQAQGGIGSSDQAPETVPPHLVFLPFDPGASSGSVPLVPPDIRPAEQEDITSSMNDDTNPTGTSVSDPSGEPAGEMELDLILRQDRRDLRAAMAVFQRSERDTARARYDDMTALVTSLGQCGRKFRREAIKQLRATVSEVYSAPRVTATAKKNPRLGIVPGLALDLTTTNSKGEPWDFNDPARRKEAEKLLDEQRPQLLIGSPMSTAFSNIQNLNKAKRDPHVVAAEIEKGRTHLKWCCHLYQRQIDQGAYVLHEHPRLATSWREPEVMNLLRQEKVDKINADQCQLGQQTDIGEPLKKPTGFMSNAPLLLSKLNRKCFG